MHRLTLALLLFSLSMSSVAHDGHDHSIPMADLIHLLWITPLLIVVIVLHNKVMNSSNKFLSSFNNKR